MTPQRLFEVADKGFFDIAHNHERLTHTEFDHIERCEICLTNYAESILQAARVRAKDKVR